MANKTLLFIDGCVRGEGVSRTRKLCDAFIEALGDRYDVLHIDLDKLKLSPMNRESLEYRNSLISAKKLEDPLFDLSHQFAAADAILVGAPYWDWSFPACIKTYIERISVDGITFHYEGSDCIGNCHAYKALYLSTAGGLIPNGNEGAAYIKGVFNNYGIHHFEDFTAEALDIWESDSESIMNEALARVRTMAKEF